MTIDRRHGGSKLPTPSQRQTAAAVAAAKPPGSDPTGEHHATCRQIADEAGRDVVEVLDCWSERAALRQWCGGQSLADAERDAVSDVRKQYLPQAKLAL